jgi:2Fe-2S ferredoxin
MVALTLIEPSGRERRFDARPGLTLMEAAMAAGVQGIDADCGGAAACATCHVHVAADWCARLPAPAEAEEAMLEFVAAPAPGSRLSCQILLGPELDGLVARVAPEQG